MDTFLIEGEWSGYHSGQRRVVHREYIKQKARAEAVSKLGWIQYTDGTCLSLSVKILQGRINKKALPPINGYTHLIDECIRKGVNSVAALQRREQAEAIKADAIARSQEGE